MIMGSRLPHKTSHESRPDGLTVCDMVVVCGSSISRSLVITFRIARHKIYAYLAKCTQNIVLIVLVGVVSHANQTIKSPKADESVHQILVLLEDLLQRK